MRVLIVDDHRIVASGCRALFADDPEIDIVEASDAESGERVFGERHPDICVLDINLPTVSGFELARRLLGRDASARRRGRWRRPEARRRRNHGAAASTPPIPTTDN